MKATEGAFLRKVSSVIILVTSLSIIGMMTYGGCGGGGGGGGDDDGGNGPAPTATFTPPTPTRTPGGTGFPPSCDGTFGVSLSCPAVSLEGSVCQPYIFDVIDDSGPEPIIVDESVTLRFGDKCIALDCFTLDCTGIPSGATVSTFIIETVNDVAVGEDVQGEIHSGCPEGPIFIDDNEYYFDCQGLIVP